MLFNSTKLTLANILIIGVILTTCSNNWVSMWIGLEASLLSFIPFIQNRIKTRSESSIKYFIVQRVASTLFMLAIICILVGINILSEALLTTSILIKLGSAPFHNWVLIVIENINYIVLLNLLTTLKVPPLMILYQINRQLLITPIVLRIVLGAVMCINQSSVRKTLGFSSIYNLRIIIIVINKLSLVINYMLIYLIIIIPLTIITLKIKINFINQIVFNDHSIWIKINMWINMLSIGGFPPLIGFLGKIIILQTLTLNSQPLLLRIIVLTSILVILFYMRIAFTSIIRVISFKKWTISNSQPFKFLIRLNLTVTPVILTIKRIF